MRFVATRPHGVLYLLECLRGDPHHSTRLAEWFRARRGARPDDVAAVRDYRALVEAWSRLHLPGDGGKQRTLQDVLESLAVRSDDGRQFLESAWAVLNVADHARLARAFRQFEDPYDALVWRPCGAQVRRQLATLRARSAALGMGSRLARVALLYQSEWPRERPFVVALTPIPRQPGEHFTTFGHSDGYLEVVEAPQGAGVEHGADVALHELCHSLWSTRPDAVQQRLKEAFLSADGALAYGELNEGLATALGNAWPTLDVSGQPPPGRWYEDRYIDGFAHALLPLLQPYLRAGRPLDGAFARRAVTAFHRAFPTADRDPSLVMREVLVLSNAPEVASAEFHRRLGGTAVIHSTYAAMPLAEPESRTRFASLARASAVFMVRPEEIAALRGYGVPVEKLAGMRDGAWCTRQGALVDGGA